MSGRLSPSSERERFGQERVPSVDQHLVHGWCHRQEFGFCTHVVVLEEQGLQNRSKIHLAKCGKGVFGRLQT